MPRGDRTGPWGQGPMSGRAMGYCAGYPNPGFMSFGPGFGFGRGFGRGRGWRGFGFGPTWGYSYPPMMGYGYPFGTFYENPYPQGVPYPYGTEYVPGAPNQRRSQVNQSRKQKPQKN